jgi:D-3-phosphoglycerate dehydrogenase
MRRQRCKVLVADPLDARGLAILKKEPEIRADVKTGLSHDQLKKVIGHYDAIIVRSATKVTKDLIEKGKKLKVIGRAGVGVDNVDLEAATKQGVIVMNTPEGNATATAEHTWSLLLALTRHLVPGNLSVRKGEWKRTRFTGTELSGKTVGIIGFGRIGREVAKRALAFGMKVIAYDPFLAGEAVKMPEIQLVSDLKKLLPKADFITLHVPLTDDTHHMLGKKAFALMKRGVRIVNCARGGIVDETALYEALKAKKVKGAALDVFEKEPPDPSNPLLGLDEVTVTPHLGAATEEARENTSLAVAVQVADALLNRGIKNAVNLPSLDGDTYQVLKPWIHLAEKLGLFHIQLFEGNIREVDVKVSGEATHYNLAPLTIAVLKGLLTPVSGPMVNYVNATTLAKERGITVNESKTTSVEDFANAISVTVKTSRGLNTVTGSLFGNRDPRIVRVNQFHVDAVPKGTMLVVTNVDKPGLVGSLGTLLGKRRINIAEMTLGRKREGTYAITVINTDQLIPQAVLKEIKSLKHILDAKVVKL